MYIVTIDESKCVKAGECVSVCPTEIYKKDGERTVVQHTEECIYCQSCLAVCAAGAITITEA
jgi:NAD-dependent dihydropyrimidine dehydrogenase PreA subunit